MGIISIDKDETLHSLTITADYDAPLERVWQLWTDVSQLQRWWGPPGWPAEFSSQELLASETVTYHMTGPDGERAHGWWRVKTLDAPRLLALEDGFGDAEGTPDPDMPVINMTVHLTEQGEGTRMVIRAGFTSAEDMQKLMEMGMDEGLKASLGQIHGVLAD